MIPFKRLETWIEDGTVQIAPLAFMRGRTLENAFVILDEAQNATISQLKMFLTSYFIPALIDRWEQERKHTDFIWYDRLGDFRAFGGIRTEDNVAVTAEGCRVLGPGIPKSVADVEAAMGSR